MGAPHMSDIGSYVKAVVCGAVSATAGGAGDNSAVTGASIDRLGYESCKLVIGYKTTLAASETLQFAVEYQESDDNSSWDTAVALQAATTAKTGAATNFHGDVEFDVDLGAKKRYIRFNFTPNMSAAGTDTAICMAVCVLGGSNVLPAA